MDVWAERLFHVYCDGMGDSEKVGCVPEMPGVKVIC